MNGDVIKIFFDGEPVVYMSGLYQWETGQELEFVDSFENGTEVLFARRSDNETKRDVIKSSRVKIPDAFLMENGVIDVYITADCFKKIVLGVNARPKPPNYIEPDVEPDYNPYLKRDGWTPNIILATDDNGSVTETGLQTDESIILQNGRMSVNTANEVDGDNTLPISSAAVATIVGNIEVLLKTI